MRSSVFALLLVVVLAAGVGVLGTVAVAAYTLVSSQTAADQANSADLTKPANYGAN
jgi:hypothetical protein